MARQSLGLIGVGAFGALAAKHLAPHFDLFLFDAAKDTTTLAKDLSAHTSALHEAAACDIVLVAVPIQKFKQTLGDIAPFLKPDALVLDVCSVKIKPVAMMRDVLPSPIAIIGTHPLFGPQSGKNGIKGLNIALCNVRGNRCDEVATFCTEKLGLRVSQVSAEDHDREAAYVQGLTHMLAKIVVALDLPAMRFPTKTYELLQQMVDMVRHDSDELFHAIEQENPFVAETKSSFFAAARALEEKLYKSGE